MPWVLDTNSHVLDEEVDARELQANQRHAHNELQGSLTDLVIGIQ